MKGTSSSDLRSFSFIFFQNPASNHIHSPLLLAKGNLWLSSPAPLGPFSALGFNNEHRKKQNPKTKDRRVPALVLRYTQANHRLRLPTKQFSLISWTLANQKAFELSDHYYLYYRLWKTQLETQSWVTLWEPGSAFSLKLRMVLILSTDSYVGGNEVTPGSTGN